MNERIVDARAALTDEETAMLGLKPVEAAFLRAALPACRACLHTDPLYLAIRSVVEESIK